MSKSVVVALGLVLAFTPRLHAQAGQPAGDRKNVGSLRGSVQDPSGAVLVDAAVSLLDSSGTSVAETKTDGAGAFSFTEQAAGPYQLRAEAAGFAPLVRKATIVAGRSIVLPKMVLAMAPMSDAVTVSPESGEATTAADTNKNAVALDTQTLSDLPAFDRDVVGMLSRFLDTGSSGSEGATLVVDGMEARSVGVSSAGIQAIKINADPYAAEFQQPGRARIEVITKAGSEAYHGSLDLTFRDARFNAQDHFAPTKPPEQRRIYSGELGGPIGDGKRSSFLITLERRDEDLQSIVLAYGPSGEINGVVPRPSRSTQFSALLMHQVGQGQTFRVRFTGEFQSRKNQGVGGTTLPEAGTDTKSDEEQVIIGHRWVASKRLLSELTVLFGREVQTTVNQNQGARIVVPDSFTGGGAQSDQQTREYHIQGFENVSFLAGKHLWKAGFAIPDLSRREFTDRRNFVGTYVFASVADYEAGHPISLTQQRGNPETDYLQQVYAGYVQDTITVRSNLTLALGLRYDWQNVFFDRNNFGPRGSIAYSPDKKTVLRGGLGWFYDRGGDNQNREIIRSQEGTLLRYVITDPPYPSPLIGASTGASLPTSIVQIAPGFFMPYMLQYSAGVEREVHKGTTVALNYIGGHGTGTFRSRDVNAPPPPLYLTRPDPTHTVVRQIESTGRQNMNSIQLSIKGKLMKRVKGTVQYTFGSTHNDTSGVNSLPANNYDLSGEYGRADFDQRHRFDLLASFDGGKWLKFGMSLSARSGTPYSIVTGTDDFNTGQTNARPAGVDRNTRQAPGYVSMDVRWSRQFQFGDEKREQRKAVVVRVDAFNVTNRVNFNTPVGNLSSSFFGQSISAQPARRIQLSAGLTF